MYLALTLWKNIVFVVPFRGQKNDPNSSHEDKPRGWELLAVSFGGRVCGGPVGAGSDAEEAHTGEVPKRGAERFHCTLLDSHFFQMYLKVLTTS